MEAECKVTARINKDLYTQVQEHFHHGQQTKLLRQLFLSLDTLIKDGKLNDILDYMYKGKALNLPAIGE